ncbi:MAG: zf-HC2 domain-containing protein [Gammaproteobacteria bacterium]|nr:zf-HC2 domain-containing protein [Gammaproteobacteria bacterium]
MASRTNHIDQHVGELLSGYIDGELTQQERQRVDVHCESCAECGQLRDELREIRRDVGDARLSEIGEDNWREMMDDSTVRVTRGIGWLLLIGGFLAVAGIGIYEFLTDPSVGWTEKLVVTVIYGGFVALFVSVLRQRLIERKSDKYKDVEI